MSSTTTITHVMPQHMTIGASTALVESLLPLTTTDNDITIDASAVDVLSTAGAQVLIALTKSIDNRTMTVSPASAPLVQALREMGLHWLIPQHA